MTAPAATRLNRVYDAITGPRGAWWTMAGTIALLGLARWLLLPNASQDDAEQLLFAQSWLGGYNPAQPPLYTWLVKAAETVLGVGLYPVMLVKFACLFGLLAFLYLGAREVLADRRHAVLAALSPLAVYYVAYDAVLNYSNTVLMTACIAATFWALAMLRRRATVGRYLGLGAALGAGIMAKYGYLTFAAALLAAALLDPVLRRRLIDPRIALTAGPIALILAPHVVWWIDRGGDLAAVASSRLALSGLGYWEGVARGLLKLGNAIVTFPMPLLVVLAIVFPRAFLRTRGWQSDAHAWKRLLERFALVAIAIVAVGVLAFGVTEVRRHYMFIFLLLPIYAFLRIEHAETKAIAPPSFAAILMCFPAIVLVTLAVKHFTDPLWCRKCYFHYPYDALAAELAAAGFENGTVVAHFHRVQIAGNLRIEMPEARYYSSKYPYYAPPPAEGPGQCLALWDAQYFDWPPSSFANYVARKLGADLEAARGIASTGTVAAPMMHSDREWGLGYALMPGTGTCR